MGYAEGTPLRRMGLVPDMQARYGLPYLSVGRAPLHRALVDAAVAAGCAVEHGCVLTSADFAAAAVALADGRVFEADLVVGADGEGSQCRSLLLGRPDPPFHFGHKVFSCQVALADMAGDPALADLAAGNDPGTRWWLGPGTMAIGTIPGAPAQHMNLMGGLPEPEDAPVQGHPVPATKEEIKRVFASWDTRICKLVDLSVGCVKWTSTATAVLDGGWVSHSGRFVLLGDAAHAMTPYLAQGAAQGIEDAVALGALLSHVTDNPEDIPRALRIFQQIREPRCRRLKEASMKLRDVYCMHDGPEQEKRDHDLLYTELGPGFIIPWLEPEFQNWMYSYDAEKEAHQAWSGSEQPQ
jgi:salicylate hydroxylase